MKQLKSSSQLVIRSIVIVLLITNILLIYQNLNLRSEIEGLEPLQVQDGDVLSNFQAEDLDGNETEIDYNEVGKKRILLFFRTTCGYCKKQMIYWKELVSNAKRQNYKITTITTERDTQAIKNYMKSYGVENWEVLIIKPNEAQKAKMLSTPITVVVNDKGVVEKTWIGMWQTKDIDSAEKYFALNFTQ